MYRYSLQQDTLSIVESVLKFLIEEEVVSNGVGCVVVSSAIVVGAEVLLVIAGWAQCKFTLQ